MSAKRLNLRLRGVYAPIECQQLSPPKSRKAMAVATKGVSLGQDAWRRLRRNRMAMVSLATIITIGLLAFLAPMLPLRPPINITPICNMNLRR